MPTAKIYPAENFFIVPGKGSKPKPNGDLPLWKQQELAKDPNFRDLSEQLKGGPKETWSAKHGYALTFRQEAAILKANSRTNPYVNPLPFAKTKEPEQKQEQKSSCCTIM